MSDLRPGVCLCCNTPLTFLGKEWNDKVAPAVLCGPCSDLKRAGKITLREIRILYIMRSQIGWLFQELSILRGQMESLVESQAEMHKSFFES